MSGALCARFVRFAGVKRWASIRPSARRPCTHSFLKIWDDKHCGFHSNRWGKCCAASGTSTPTEWPNGKKKRRLDDVCCELAPEYSKNVIQSFILAGKVFVDEQKVTKAGHQVKPSNIVDIRAEVPKFVCRAGLKLEKALDTFGIDVTGFVALDSGLSTGGFTDCLLQRGAAKVFGVDVGYGQVAEKVRQDGRVVVMERRNLRKLLPTDLGEAVDIATLDLSFISVLKVMPAVAGVMKPTGKLLVLIKPQFEAGPENVSRGGVVRDPAVHDAVIRKVSAGIEALGFERAGLCESPIRGAQGGNKEFLAHFRRVRVVPAGELAARADGSSDESSDGGAGHAALAGGESDSSSEDEVGTTDSSR